MVYGTYIMALVSWRGVQILDSGMSILWSLYNNPNGFTGSTLLRLRACLLVQLVTDSTVVIENLCK